MDDSDRPRDDSGAVESEVESAVTPEVASAADDDRTADDDAPESRGDGGTPATVEAAATAGEPASDDEPFDGIEGPETDEEMPLAAHIEEMMRRLGVVFLVGGAATLAVVANRRR